VLTGAPALPLLAQLGARRAECAAAGLDRSALCALLQYPNVKFLKVDVDELSDVAGSCGVKVSLTSFQQLGGWLL
jgi:hypothetical protein